MDLETERETEQPRKQRLAEEVVDQYIADLELQQMSSRVSFEQNSEKKVCKLFIIIVTIVYKIN